MKNIIHTFFLLTMIYLNAIYDIYSSSYINMIYIDILNAKQNIIKRTMMSFILVSSCYWAVCVKNSLPDILTSISTEISRIFMHG